MKNLLLASVLITLLCSCATSIPEPKETNVVVDTYKNTTSVEGAIAEASHSGNQDDKVRYSITATKLSNGKSEFVLATEFERRRNIGDKALWLFRNRESTKVYLQGGTELKIKQGSRRVPQCSGWTHKCTFFEELQVFLPEKLIEEDKALDLAVYANETYKFIIPQTYIQTIKTKAEEAGILSKGK